MLALSTIGIKSCSKDKEVFYDENSVVDKLVPTEPDSLLRFTFCHFRLFFRFGY